jgi:GxxExxY protein
MPMQRIDANSMKAELVYPDLSYTIVGICYTVHNEIGRFGREKQYADLLEKKLKEKNIPYLRELTMGESGNIIDFLIADKLILELKTRPMVTKQDYIQVQRYLNESNIALGLLVNFRSMYLRPKRILRVPLRASH